MSPVTRSILTLLVLATCASAGYAQWGNGFAPPKFVPRDSIISDLGMMGGSSTGFMPTSSTMPESDMRFDASQTSVHSRSMYTTSLTAGLSRKMEVVLKYQTGETQSIVPQVFFGLGTKVVIPVTLPMVSRIALWGEYMGTDAPESTAFFPANLFHGAVMLMPKGLERLNAHVMLGVSRDDAAPCFLGGANASMPLSRMVKVGAEVVYGYYGMNDILASAVVAVRPLPFLGLQLMPGMLKMAGTTSASVSMGISISMTNIEFILPEKPKETNTTIVPAFDDLEKQINNEKTGDGKKNVEPDGQKNEIIQDGQ